MELREQIACYRPVNAQEEKDKEQLLAWLGSGIDLYSRDCAAAHLTASAWVVSPDRKKVLMAYHKIYNSWAWTGGHADGQRDLRAVARRARSRSIARVERGRSTRMPAWYAASASRAAPSTA